MKRILEKRKSYGKRTSHRKTELGKRERRRLAQLTVSLVLFAVALLGRNVFPERLEQWNMLLRQEVDFKGAFSNFGEAAAQGEPLLDSLGELCIEVFGGEVVEIREYTPIFDEIPAISERCREWTQSIRLNVQNQLL